MRPDEARHWQNELLDEAFHAIAASEELRSILVFKGARILAHHLGAPGRQSLDLDANSTREFLAEYPDRAVQAGRLRDMLTRALSRHFESQSPVRYVVESVRVTPQPPRGHPLGWNSHQVELRLIDSSRASQRGVPNLRVDIAFPESLGPDSTTTIEIGGAQVRVYSLERIAGEKLRAFLSSLPAYRAKTGRTGGAIRVRDIYDIHQIVERCPIADEDFWRVAGEEFRLACQSRGVNCLGWNSFAHDEDLIRDSYLRETILPKAVRFEEAWERLHAVVGFLEQIGVTPFEYALPGLRQP